MNIEDRIKNLKHLRPDAAYARRSRALIVGGAEAFRESPLGSKRLTLGGIWHIISSSMEFGAAIALAGALLIVAVGGFSTWKFLSPFNLASLDPAGLKAEAQAVDIQIQLTDVGYPENQSESTPAIADPKKQPSAAVSQLAKNLGIEEKSTNETTTLSIDETLERLAE